VKWRGSGTNRCKLARVGTSFLPSPQAVQGARPCENAPQPRVSMLPPQTHVTSALPGVEPVVRSAATPSTACTTDIAGLFPRTSARQRDHSIPSSWNGGGGASASLPLLRVQVSIGTGRKVHGECLSCESHSGLYARAPRRTGPDASPQTRLLRRLRDPAGPQRAARPGLCGSAMLGDGYPGNAPWCAGASGFMAARGDWACSKSTAKPTRAAQTDVDVY